MINNKKQKKAKEPIVQKNKTAVRFFVASLKNLLKERIFILISQFKNRLSIFTPKIKETYESLLEKITALFKKVKYQISIYIEKYFSINKRKKILLAFRKLTYSLRTSKQLKSLYGNKEVLKLYKQIKEKVLDRKDIFKRKPIYSLILFLLVIFFIWHAIYSPKISHSDKEVLFAIEKGYSSKEISNNLEKQGLIKNSTVFRFYAIITGSVAKLQAGKYLLSPAMTIPQIIKKFTNGEITKEQITIIEGWNLRDIGSYLQENGIASEEDFFKLVGFPMFDYSIASNLPQPKDFSAEFSFLQDKSRNSGLEGYLFPDTYEIKEVDNLENIVRKMLANFEKKLTPEIRQEITRQKKSIYQIVTMASLLEREVKTSEEKKIASGVLWKRMASNIPLQVDATIIYITGKKGGKVSLEETRLNSPYNTYVFLGLPLGPICNPGIDSIMAAVYPQNSDYWYYLSTREGKTIFSRTLEEHNIARAKYLK